METRIMYTLYRTLTGCRDQFELIIFTSYTEREHTQFFVPTHRRQEILLARLY